MITGLDHIALVVRDLDGSIEDWRRLLGKEPDWLGGDGGARHAWFQLDNMALDLIAPDGPGAFGEVIRRHLDGEGEGVWAISLRTTALTAATDLLARRGVRAAKPGTTRSTHVDGRRRFWTITSLDAADTAGVQILLVDPPKAGEAWPPQTLLAEPRTRLCALDHVVINTDFPDRALGLWGAKLGLELRLDRSNEAWGVRQLFFRCGSAVVEFVISLKASEAQQKDRFGGLAFRVGDAVATQARLAAQGFGTSQVRLGRKPGSRVFTVRDGVAGAPVLIIEQADRTEAANEA
jgi:catechol 2,3-dioxygenase-like lactoylglutathione lyase family enzyme